VNQLSWSIEAKIVHIPLNSENQSRPNVYQENIKFERMNPCLSSPA